MPAIPSIALFHQWLLATAPKSPVACSIVLHGTPPTLSPRLSGGIVSYLNEYDDGGDGRWLALQPDLVPLIADDPPSPRPRGHHKRRLFRCGSGSLS